MVAVGLPFHLISIFILGTPSNYWNRMVPISNTWGQHFEHLYFVMGKGRENVALKKNCERSDKLDDLELLTCLPGNITYHKDRSLNFADQINPISLLYSSKCLDRYFGASPTCKLKHAMIYFMKSPRLRAVEWFIFMDDDNYVQPYALSSFLHARSLSNSHLSYTRKTNNAMDGTLLLDSNDVTSVTGRRAESFVGCGLKYVGSLFANGKAGASECKNLPKFCWAQPAIINREAMHVLQPTVEYGMLARLQKIWGGSHDVILGMLLWLHDLPTIPLHSVMHYCPITQELLASGALQADPLCGHVLIYHKIQNRKGIIGHSDMANLLHDRSIRDYAAAKKTAAATAAAYGMSTTLPRTLSASAIEHERAAGQAMSDNIDALIATANIDPPSTTADADTGTVTVIDTGMYNMYWHGGRVHSMARDFYKYKVLRKGQTLRPFMFKDCGLKPVLMRFKVEMVCGQRGPSIAMCCTNETCQRTHMSYPFPPAKGVINF